MLVIPVSHFVTPQAPADLAMVCSMPDTDPDESSPGPGAPPPAAALVADAPTDGAPAPDTTPQELTAERAERKREQVRLAELEDENRRLKTAPAPAARQQKKGWLHGATFFDEED